MFKINTKVAAHWATILLVLLVSGLAGQFAAHGMNSVQWLGAGLAVLGSITLAVMVRVWPAEVSSRRD